MLRIAALLSAFVFVVSAAAQTASGADGADLVIEAGRLGAMMSESRDLLPLLAVPQPPPLPGTPQPAHAIIFDTLVLAVLDYNVVSFQACHTGAVDASLCLGPYLPVWLSGKPDDFSDRRLRVMTDDAGARLMPFWSALCANARIARAPEPVCPME